MEIFEKNVIFIFLESASRDFRIENNFEKSIKMAALSHFSTAIVPVRSSLCRCVLKLCSPKTRFAFLFSIDFNEARSNKTEFTVLNGRGYNHEHGSSS